MSGRSACLSEPLFESPELVLGEIVEASTTRLIAQCPRERLYTPPELGQFVCVAPPGSVRALPTASSEEETSDPFADPSVPSPRDLPHLADETIYAVVSWAETSSLEPGRRAAAYGLDEAELRREQPQIFDLLTTEFAAVIVGFARDGRAHPYLPPRPPRLHAMVTPCAVSEIRALSNSPDLLRALLAASGEVSADELVAAALRHACHARNQDFAFLVRSGKQIATLLRDDPDRLAALLRKLEP